MAPPTPACFATSPHVPSPLCTTHPGGFIPAVHSICPSFPTAPPRPSRSGRAIRRPRSAFEPVWEEPPPEAFDQSHTETCDAVRISSLRLAFRPEVSAHDAKAVLVEYARKTCGEPGVLRCDVLHQRGGLRSAPLIGSEAGFRASAEFTVLTVFSNALALSEHERSSHANKLRVMLAGKGDTNDTGVVLAKLAVEANLYRTYWPGAVNGWKSAVDRSPKKQPALPGDDPTGPLRYTLNILVQDVGLEDATVLIASATVARDDYVQCVQEVCAAYARKLLNHDGEETWHEEGNAGVVRAGVLLSMERPRDITVLQVHERDHPNGALFDADLAADLLDNKGWTVLRYVSIFPDLAGWKVIGLDDLPWTDPSNPDGEWGPSDENGQRSRFVTVEELYKAQESAKQSAAQDNGQAPRDVTVSPALASNVDGQGTNDRGSSVSVESSVDRGGDVNGDGKKPNAGSDSDGKNRVGNESSLTECSSGKSGKTPPAPALGSLQLPGRSPPLFTSDMDGEAIQQLRVAQGVGAFANIEKRMRSMAGLALLNKLHVYAVSGWNEARLQPLVEELDEGVEAGRATLAIGGNVYGASATLAKVGAAVSEARRHNAHVIAAFGGGAVMDCAKAVAALVRLRPNNVSVVLEKIRSVAESGQTLLELKLGMPTAPLLLVPGTIGSGAEVTENALLSVPLSSGRMHRISVVFTAPQSPRVALVDPRLVMPRRMYSHDAALGGLQALCFALDTLLCAHAPAQAAELAARAVKLAQPNIMRARREPESSDGPSRVPLMQATVLAGLARDSCGGLGAAACMSVAMLDGAEASPQGLDAPLRVLLPRVMAAVVESMEGEQVVHAAQIVLEEENASGARLSTWLLELAEDVGVPLLGNIGIMESDIRRAAEVALTGGLLSKCVHDQMRDIDLLVQVGKAAVAQRYSL